MTESRNYSKGVVLPEPSKAKRHINDQLIKIKEELILDDEHSDTDLSFEYTQPIRPQQFYAEIDAKLECLNRDDYKKELLLICNNDYSKLVDYRDRLAERAQSHPNCPQTRLVNRRNSATGTKEDKCASDCYTLYAFNHGVQNREISDVFTSTISTDHETILIKDDEQMQLISPDLFGIISKLQSDIVDIKKKQAMDSVILESVRTDVNTTLVLFRTIHGTLNSVLSRVGSLTETITQSTQLRADCERVETSLTTIQNRLVTCDENQHTGVTEPVTSPPFVATRTTVCNSTDATATKTFATVAATPAKPPTTPNLSTKTDARESEAITITVGETAHPQKDRQRKEQDRQHDEPYQHHLPTGFKAARRKNVLSYFVGNIDIDASKEDIYDHMKYNGVTPTFINVYYGRNGAGAKVNVHVDDEVKVEDPHFWPSDIVFRKWVSKEEWEKDKPQFRQRQRRKRYQHWGHDRSDRYNHDGHEKREPRHHILSHRDANDHSNHRRGKHHGYSGNDRYHNDYERDDYKDDNEWDNTSIDY